MKFLEITIILYFNEIGRDINLKGFRFFREKVRCIRYYLYEATITQFFGELDLIWRFIIHRVPKSEQID